MFFIYSYENVGSRTTKRLYVEWRCGRGVSYFGRRRMETGVIARARTARSQSHALRRIKIGSRWRRFQATEALV